MKIFYVKHLRICSLILLLVWALQPTAKADPVPVRSVAGTIHGFLELRSEDGQVVASGDSFQVVRGNHVTARTVFHFKDGSIDDETTVFSQRHTFQLISDHRIQKGPSFPHPTDVLINAQTGEVIVHSRGKDGKEEVKTDHLDLPPDLANGLVPVVLQNLPPNAPVTTRLHGRSHTKAEAGETRHLQRGRRQMLCRRLFAEGDPLRHQDQPRGSRGRGGPDHRQGAS